MCSKFILVFLAIGCCVGGLFSESIDLHDNSHMEMPVYEATSFDYDYRVEPKHFFGTTHYLRTDTPTTERPLVRYWNNFIRSVRLPVPTITWNMTNPLVNLFNGGQMNAMETPVTYKSTKRKRKHSRKTTSYKRNKNRKRPVSDYYDGDQPYQDEEVQAELQQPLQVVQPYGTNTIDINRAVYFYVPNYQVPQQQYSFNNDNQKYIKLVATVEQDEDEPTTQTEQANEEDAVSQYEEVVDHKIDAEDVQVPMAENPESEGIVKPEDNTMNVLNKVQDDKEMIRSMLGSYEAEDSFTRMRQRVGNKAHATKKYAPMRGRGTLRRYFFLHPL